MSDTGGDPLLDVVGLDAAVEGFQATYGVDLEIGRGEAVGLIGRNGAGKTTTFRAIMGAAEKLSGTVHFAGEDITDLDADLIPKRGIGYQPEDRGLFTGMTVEENVRMPVWTAGDARGIEDEDAVVAEILDLFDELDERRNAKVQNLSGGEGKMAAIGRALALRPDLLLLDEPLEGLAPIVVEKLKSHIRAINEQGISVLIAESNASHVPEIVDRMYVIERGEIIASGDPDVLMRDEEIQRVMQG